MDKIALVTACFVIGMLLKRSGRLGDGAPKVFNTFIINVSLPAVALRYLHDIPLSFDLLYLVAMPCLLLATSLGFAMVMGRMLSLSREQVGCLALVGGVSNTSILGLPMVEAYFGRMAFGPAMVADQASLIVLCTAGVAIATAYSVRAEAGQSSLAAAVLRRIIGFPTVQAAVVAIALRPVTFPPQLLDALNILGGTLTPLALVSAGALFQADSLRSHLREFTIGIVGKLILGPVVILGLFVGVMGGSGPVVQVALFQAAMPSMITASVIAIDHDLSPPLATLLVTAGIPLSFVSIYLWWQVIAIMG